MMRDTVEYVVRYARMGWHAFPLWPLNEDLACACATPHCTSPGKHPLGILVPKGCHDATTDETTIRQWWSLYPDANAGIATGAVSGLVVLDIDGQAGQEALIRLETRYGALPGTIGVTTGKGGHIYWRHPGGALPNSAGFLGPGLDIRGDGGYVVAPPSLHQNGRRYQFAGPTQRREVELTGPPAWLVTMLAGKTLSAPGRLRGAPPIPLRILEGSRNHTLTSLAGTLRNRGGTAEELLQVLSVWNKRCEPPLPELELVNIARSVARYDPAPIAQIG